MRPYGLCRTVSDADVARWKLEVDRRGSFTVRELALLADVSDTAALKSIGRWRKERDHDAYVSTYSTLKFEEAMGWLSEQPGFVSPWKLSKDDPRVQSRLAEVRSTEALHDFVQVHRMPFVPHEDLGR